MVAPPSLVGGSSIPKVHESTVQCVNPAANNTNIIDRSTHAETGFLRINTSTAPLNPPGAAPTLTTIYDEAKCPPPEEFCEPSASTVSHASKSKKPRRLSYTSGKRRFMLAKAAPASVAVEGTKAEKKRMQGIADSLDIGEDLEPAISDQAVDETDAKNEAVIAEEEPSLAIVDCEETTRYSGGKYIYPETHGLVGQRS